MKIKPEGVERQTERFRESCRRAGIKSTPQRKEIYRELVLAGGHPDVETLYHRVRKKIPALSLDTVYRTLRSFEKMGILSRVRSLGERIRLDTNPNPHYHFICTRCGMIGDFYYKDGRDVRISNEVTAMGTVNTIYIELRGLCKACQKNSETKNRSAS